MAAQRFWPRPFPADASVIFIDGNHEGIARLIANQNNVVARYNRRHAHAIDVVERTERHTPALIAVETVRDESEISEENVNAFAVSNGAGRSSGVALIQRFGAIARALA